MPHPVPDCDLVPVPAGTYTIGLSHDMIAALPPGVVDGHLMKARYLAASIPRHEVALGGFSMGRRHITCREFRVFVESAPYLTESERRGWGWTWEEGWLKREGLSWRRPFGNEHDGVFRNGDSDLPVLQVSWNDAAAFCRWVSNMRGRPVRLPMEAEWEAFASIAGQPSVIDAAADQPGPVAVTEYLRRLGDEERGGTAGIGLLWEWTGDWFDRYPGGPGQGGFGTTYRVLRGGSLLSLPIQRTREFRFRRCPTARSPFYGFRIAFPGG
ncbi:MAG: SUMF1/EgtB/PvdO family nonheme iron enzyme [Spirochaetes bacterium]|nr:SUMF1/EgtB/PvdO family nonheme iron enzyme [Spirochaetota bacterium]